MLPASRLSGAALCAIALSFCVPYPALGFTKTGTTYTTDGSLADAQAAVNDSVDGNVIKIPSGSFLWGTGGTFLSLTKAVTLVGAGTANTSITLADDSQQGTAGVIRIQAAAIVKDFAINGAVGNSITFFSTGSTSGWRITNITTHPSAAGGYFIRINRSYGLIDNCNITGAAGNNELIFALGPGDSWQTPDSLGGANNVFVEDCTFNGPGYVCDSNENSRMVVRFCTINGQMKVDGHGLASNPPRGVRETEVYGNHWTATGGSWPAIEIRGGTSMIFNNTKDSTVNLEGVFFLTDYGYLGAFAGFNSVLQTPLNYPLNDQIGVGADPKVAASDPAYVWNNLKGGTPWPRTYKIVSTAATTLYQQQTGNSTFVESDIIKANRDFFADAGFDTSTGVSIGTKAQMLAMTPSVVGYGFWVTDEGEWNTLHSGVDGQLYVWTGTTWTLKYKPYTYPHPMRAPIAPSNLRMTSP